MKAAEFARVLDRSSNFAQALAVLLCAVVSARFAIASVQHALGVSQANFLEKPKPHGGAPAASGKAARARPAPRIPAEPRESVPDGRPVRLTLGVTVGASRSEVYVNGSRVGMTPYFGDTSCKAGQPLKIDLVPAEGLPLSYERQCRPGMLTLDQPPP